MKTMMKLLVAAVLAVMMLCGAAALAEEEETFAPDPASLVYESKWVNDKGDIDIWYEEAGFRVQVNQSASGHRIAWSYSCFYDKETGTLRSVSSDKIRYELDAMGEDKERIVMYENLQNESVFSLNEQGELVWLDAVENAGEGQTFRKIGHFEGEWVCDRAQITIVWGDERYDVQIHWADGALESHDWGLIGVYNAEKDQIEALGMESVTVYDENGGIVSVTDVNPEGCEAFFRINENGCLIWEDAAMAEQLAGMVFEPAE